MSGTGGRQVGLDSERQNEGGEVKWVCEGGGGGGGCVVFFFFCNDTATAGIYTLSLHDAHPNRREAGGHCSEYTHLAQGGGRALLRIQNRKAARRNGSHEQTPYDVFCSEENTPENTQ